MKLVQSRDRRRFSVHRLAAAAVLLATVLALASSVPVAAAGAEVLPAGEKHYGTTYEELSSLWWKWAYEQPLSVNPLFDETGANCRQDQHGRIWYLAGVFNETGTATRTCTIPARRALFIPILNNANDNLGVVPPVSEAALRAAIHDQLDAAILSSLLLEVDGEAVPFYRIDDGVTFSYRLPKDNLWRAFGYDFPRQVVRGAVSGGYYALLTPLPNGVHTIHIHGESSFGFTLDITYHLTVR